MTLDVEGYASPVDYLIEEGYLARPVFDTLIYSAGNEFSDSELASLAAALDVPEDLLAALAVDEQRNLAILYRVERLTRSHTAHYRIRRHGRPCPTSGDGTASTRD